jgi:hypothetical protein
MSISETSAAPNAAMQSSPATIAALRKERFTGAKPAAVTPRAWPRPLTGCVSAISMCRCQSSGYRDALENFGAICSSSSDWLGAAIPHDYDASTATASAGGVCGCLTAELIGTSAPPQALTEEDIEACGYLGWLHS